MSGQEGTGDGDNADKMRLSWPGGSPDEDDYPEEEPAERPTVVDREWRATDFEPLEGEQSHASPSAYVRLADGVLQRLRVVGEDVSTDLTELRAEVASLRQAVEDVSGRVHLRQVRAAVDDLRSDVTGLRRAVLEWPELERVSADVTALRADVTDLLERRTKTSETGGKGRRTAAAGLGSLAPLIEAIEALRDDLPTLEPVLAELAELRQEVQQLKRRIALRVQ